jgi:hypothetical protein
MPVMQFSQRYTGISGLITAFVLARREQFVFFTAAPSQVKNIDMISASNFPHLLVIVEIEPTTNEVIGLQVIRLANCNMLPGRQSRRQQGESVF